MARGSRRCYVRSMSSFLSTIALPIALAAVTVVLLLGLANMLRGGNPNRSQRLMQLRVLFQFFAIIIAMLARLWPCCGFTNSVEVLKVSPQRSYIG